MTAAGMITVVGFVIGFLVVLVVVFARWR